MSWCLGHEFDSPCGRNSCQSHLIFKIIRDQIFDLTLSNFYFRNFPRYWPNGVWHAFINFPTFHKFLLSSFLFLTSYSQDFRTRSNVPPSPVWSNSLKKMITLYWSYAVCVKITPMANFLSWFSHNKHICFSEAETNFFILNKLTEKHKTNFFSWTNKKETISFWWKSKIIFFFKPNSTPIEIKQLFS